MAELGVAQELGGEVCPSEPQEEPASVPRASGTNGRVLRVAAVEILKGIHIDDAKQEPMITWWFLWTDLTAVSKTWSNETHRDLKYEIQIVA